MAYSYSLQPQSKSKALTRTHIAQYKANSSCKIVRHPYLRVLVIKSDPIQPPGDDCGGAGAVGGAGHRVTLVGCQRGVGGRVDTHHQGKHCKQYIIIIGQYCQDIFLVITC